jgi:hypothetical protein
VGNYFAIGKALQDTAVTPNIPVADNADDLQPPDEDENAQPDDKQQRKMKEACN